MAANALQLPLHVKPPGRPVDVRPLQAQQFTLPQAGGDSHPEQRLKVGPFGGFIGAEFYLKLFSFATGCCSQSV